MSISQIFVLSRRGDTIIYRDFRKDIKKCNETFFRKVNFFTDNEEAPPLFNIDGINFIYMKNQDLYFAIATLDNSPPNYFLGIIERIMNVIKDHIGELTEEAIRKNFVLIYEIIDEMIDFGYPQLSTTEQVVKFVYTEPIVSIKNITKLKDIFLTNTKSNESTKMSVTVTNDEKSRNEIFVDIIEKVTCLFNKGGKIINSGIDGAVKLKSYLKNDPELRIVFGDNTTFGNGSKYNSSRTLISEYNCYQGTRMKDLENNNTLYIVPPAGEFILMNYHINKTINPPFKIYSIIDESDYKLELVIKLQANFSPNNKGGNIRLKFNVPKETQSVHFNIPKNLKDIQKCDYNQNDKNCIWKIPKIIGGEEMQLDVKITLQNNKPNECRREIGPISLSFEIPNFNLSGMEINELKVMTNDNKYNAAKWVRTFCLNNSYIFRVA